ncbi:DUF3467 domain-containing protein [Flavobacteriaceae bacterium Ap0902]|nr:DUF3467 domain-containing protein [Flavobacteriaceae bacterium Ap0902]
MDNQNNQNNKNFDIEINQETASGIYSNLAMINHSPTEFVVDFIQVMPGMPKAQVKSRVILTPHHAKRVLQALQGNIQKYEENFGKIQDQDPNGQQGNAQMPFGIKGEA